MENKIESAIATIKEHVMNAIANNELHVDWCGSFTCDEHFKDNANVSVAIKKDGTLSVSVCLDGMLSEMERLAVKEEFKTAKVREVDERLASIDKEKEQLLKDRETILAELDEK